VRANADDTARVPSTFIKTVHSIASDRLNSLQDKMHEYLNNGAFLGFLIDRKHRKVYRYRPNQAPEILDHPEEVGGDPELPGFALQMAKIW